MSQVKDGRFWLPDWIVSSGLLKELNESEMRVLLVYARLASNDGIAWPSKDMVAEIAGISLLSVPGILKSLVEKEVLQKAAGDNEAYQVPVK